MHNPVLVNEVISFLVGSSDPTYPVGQKGKIYVDCTFGLGGHTRAILEKIRISEYQKSRGAEEHKKGIRVYGIDIDRQSLEKAKSELDTGRVELIHGNFRQLSELILEKQVAPVAEVAPLAVDGVLFDLGISSEQLEDGRRGFSYRHNGPLDMRMNCESGVPCFKLIEKLKVDDMEYILKQYGEERWSRKIARNICEKKPKTTQELYEIVLSAIPFKYSKRTRTLQASSETGRVLARVFQALRIYVNDELENLRVGLKEALKILKKDGRICVISYHSLEDRIVKNFFRFNDNLVELTKKPVRPHPDEIFKNHRARSAKLRCAMKIE